MSSNHRRLSLAERAQTTANLRLASRFVREMIEDPERFEALPDDATLVLLPTEDAPDSALLEANLRMAKQAKLRGQRVVVWSVGMRSGTGPQFIAGWPIMREDTISIRYDRHRDALTVAFSATNRPTMPARINDYVTMMIDPETRVAVNYTIPRFLSTVAPKSLALFDLLLLAGTELHGITPEELNSIRNQLVHGKPRPQKEFDPQEFLTEIAALSA
jgi:hypothetical protein